MTDKLSVTLEIAERVYSLAQQHNASALMIGACRALAFTLYYLGDFETALQYARRGAQIWHSGVMRFPAEELNAPAVSCLTFEALSEWHIGEIAACRTAMAKATR
jgi:hypothetical protein